MEYYGNIIAVTVDDLTKADNGSAVMSYSCYKHLVIRRGVNILRPGKGYGSYALIEYASLPERFKARFVEKYGNPEDIMKKEQAGLPQDQAAQRFFYDHILPNGEHIPENKQEEYTINARVLNALQEMFNTQKDMRRACNNNTPVIWANIFKASEELRDAYHHSRGVKPASGTNSVSMPKKATPAWYPGSSATVTPPRSRRLQSARSSRCAAAGSLCTRCPRCLRSTTALPRKRAGSPSSLKPPSVSSWSARISNPSGMMPCTESWHPSSYSPDITRP